MRNFPVDADRVRLISTGNVTPIPVWVELSDGSRQPDPAGRHGRRAGPWRLSR